jgi:hypothetical protein
MMLVNPLFWLALLLGGLVAYGGGRWQQSHADAAKYEADRTKAALSAAVDQVRAVERARDEEQRRTAAQTEIANAAIQNAKSAQADARIADAARRELLARVTALVNASRSAGNTNAVGGGPSAGDAAGLLADVLGKIDQRAQELAEFADAAHIAGQACERSYDALMPR